MITRAESYLHFIDGKPAKSRPSYIDVLVVQHKENGFEYLVPIAVKKFHVSKESSKSCLQSPTTNLKPRICHFNFTADTVYSRFAMAEPGRTSHFGEQSPPVTPDGEEPTEEEVQYLRHVPDRIPLTSWLVAGISLTERVTYYGINSPFRKFRGTSDNLWSLED